MTRINTNVSSLVAQKSLQRSNAQLQTSLTRLSTGLRINVGKDDPAGLIASEALRSDIVSVRKAISNSERANQLVATADSALGQVSSLLNDIRGLVTEAANVGAQSEDQIAANQLQVDSSLEALNRIAQTTAFQGKRLLDGSLDFLTTPGSGFSTVQDLQIDQANLGSAGSVAVDVQIAAAADQARVTTTVPVSTSAVAATAVINFAEGPSDIDVLTITAATAGAAANGINVQIVESASVTATAAEAIFADNTLTILVNDTATTATTVADIATAIDNLAEFSAAATTTGSPDGDYVTGTDIPGVVGALGDELNGGALGVDLSTGLLDDVSFELSGQVGSEVFTFQSGTSALQIAAAVNLVSDATGVTASVSTSTLTLESAAYGEKAFVDVGVISEGGSGTFESGLSALRDIGDDISATVNGIAANGNGNTFSINTSSLDLTVTVDAGSSTNVAFNITGGGALFQLGPDVVTSQQARLGIQSVNTARLGGVSGRLFQLGSGGSAALATDTTLAADIIDETIAKVTGLRGRLGAFQKTTLETNIFTLNDTLANLTDAESSIRDADFAAESAQLTRAQILVQSGTSVLAIANSNPQNVLALLR